MPPKRQKIERFAVDDKIDIYPEDDELQPKNLFEQPKDQPGPCSSVDKSHPQASYSFLELIENQLHRPQLDVREIGRLIADGMLEKQLTDEDLREMTRRVSKSIQQIPNINVWELTEQLSKGTCDSRHVVIGNAFLWNLLKSSMSTVRDKFDHYHFKMSSITTCASTAGKVELISTRARPGHHIIELEHFVKTDLLEAFQKTIFRKTGDWQSKCKQFCKAYFSRATEPKCAIWHYSLRVSGSSHKKTLQDLPFQVLDTLLNFLLVLAGFGNRELEQKFEDLNTRSRFFITLGNTDEARELEFDNMKSVRENLLAKFRSCITDVLNEIREMPFHLTTGELSAPPRGKPVDPKCVTWRMYEGALKRYEAEPTKENLEAKNDLAFRLRLSYQSPHRNVETDLEVDVDK